MRTERIAHGDVDETLIPDEEGRKHIRMHVNYERSVKNRAAAIRIHGTTCIVCGFNFNQVYGEDLARSYIVIHHLESITDSIRVVDPKCDLAPLCSNCHSMVHRRSGEIIPLDELRAIFLRKSDVMK